jgi:putative transposase
MAYEVRRYGCSMVARLKELEDENRRLKQMYAEERLKSEIIQEAMAKKW